MPLLTWNEEYSVNVKEIDEQHQKLVDNLNMLQDAMKTGQGKEVLALLLNDLVQYTKTHFSTEEKYFDEFGYPDTFIHKKEHRAFDAKVLDFKTKFENGSVVLTVDVMNFLNDWLVNHIKGSDKKYSEFFNENGLF